MSYTNLDPKSIDEKQQNKESHKIKGCMSKHIFEYVPYSITVYNSEYLRECEECIKLNFSSHLKEAIELDETVEQVNVNVNVYI